MKQHRGCGSCTRGIIHYLCMSDLSISSPSTRQAYLVLLLGLLRRGGGGRAADPLVEGLLVEERGEVGANHVQIHLLGVGVRGLGLRGGLGAEVTNERKKHPGYWGPQNVKRKKDPCWKARKGKDITPLHFSLSLPPSHTLCSLLFPPLFLPLSHVKAVAAAAVDMAPSAQDVLQWNETINFVAKVGSLISGSLAFVGGLVPFLIFPGKRSFPRRLPAYMIIAAIGLNIATALGSFVDAACTVQAIGMFFFGWSCLVRMY